MKRIRILLIIIVLFFSMNIVVKANIMCNDGTESPTCTYNHSGCCSHHWGVDNSYYDYEEDYDEDYDYDYDEDYEEDESNSDGNFVLGLLIVAGICFGGYKLFVSSQNK